MRAPALMCLPLAGCVGVDAPIGADAPVDPADAPLDAPFAAPDALSCSSSSCQGDDLLCDTTIIHCPLGCAALGSAAACVTLVPYNLGEATCRPEPVAIELHFTKDVVINTNSDDSCSFVIAAPPTCILRAMDIVVDAGVTVRFVGARAAVLVGKHGIELNGRIDVGAEGSVHGAGTTRYAYPLGNGQAAGDPGSVSGGGGGGAGHATAGGVGAEGAGGTAAGGAPYEEETLEGGAFGGGGGIPMCSVVPCQVTPGGAGGGAVHIVACEELTIGPFATVNAGGGGGSGGAGARLGVVSPSGGGGGGAGGSILIEAPSMQLPAAAALWAAGGGGGGGGGVGGEGTNGPRGDNGLDASCDMLGCHTGEGGAGGGGRGGDGGNGGIDGPPEDGMPGTGRVNGGGGGGGAAGIIRIHTRSGSADLNGRVVPAPSMGTVETAP